MVKALHEAGIEVILDVVYNHTAEGDHMGPTLSFRGIDNAAYYRLDGSEPWRYLDYTGCGNSLNARHPHALQLVMDSLRYWILEMHVDGFRFDLASALARELHDVDRLSTFFDLVQQDPVVSQVKLIAEPWDVGEGGYQVGNFPPLWTEWNGKYRDTVRDFWRGRPEAIGEFASRLTGSSDLYATSGRRPVASINFVTCHDGFTLQDLVSYNHKHNEANGEGNRDGTDDNRSWNCGVEGPTDDPAVNALRVRQKRNFLVTLFLSQGVPMLLAGDEMGRTQGGNNNAYCQDNETSWLDWSLADAERDLLQFTETLAGLRRDHPVFRRRRFFRGRKGPDDETSDIIWLTPAGQEMTQEDWDAGYAQSLAALLNGEAISEPDPRGGKISGRQVPAAVQRAQRSAHVHPARGQLAPGWEVVIDTRHGGRQRRAAWSHPDPEERSRGRRPGRRRAAVDGLTVRQIFASSDLRDTDLAALYDYPSGPWLRANMVSSADGAAHLGGATSGLSSEADRHLFALLRTLADVIVVGAATVRAERYAPVRQHELWPDLRPGRTPTPPIAVVTARLDLDPSSRLIATAPPSARTIVITTAQAPADRRAALDGLAEVIVAGQETVDLKAAVAALAERGHRRMLTEGGPHLLAQIAAAGLLDELCLTIGPLLAGPGADRIVAGPLLRDGVRRPAAAARPWPTSWRTTASCSAGTSEKIIYSERNVVPAAPERRSVKLCTRRAEPGGGRLR